MRPCWSADPSDMLVTATAPLCNQGIHSHFYPASASFFLTERLPGSPATSLLPLHPQPWWARRAGGCGGQNEEAGGVRSPAAHTLGSPSPSAILGLHLWAAGGLGQGFLESSMASRFVHPLGRQSCAGPNRIVGMRDPIHRGPCVGAQPSPPSSQPAQRRGKEASAPILMPVVSAWAWPGRCPLPCG